MRRSEGSFEEGYEMGYIDGRNDGFTSGYEACLQDYEVRWKKMQAELLTLNARIDYINSVLDKEEKGI